MKVYQKIKQYMDEKGIKQNYVSEKSEIPENTLSMILNGKRKLDADEFIRIVLALDVSPDLFISSKNYSVLFI